MQKQHRRSLAALMIGHAGVQDGDSPFCERCFGHSSHAPRTIPEHAGQSSRAQIETKTDETKTASLSFGSSPLQHRHARRQLHTR